MCQAPFTVGDGFNCTGVIKLMCNKVYRDCKDNNYCHANNDTVPDPCLSDPCDANAVCIRVGLLTDEFTCTCQSPFLEGNGFNCSGTKLSLNL